MAYLNKSGYGLCKALLPLSPIQRIWYLFLSLLTISLKCLSKLELILPQSPLSEVNGINSTFSLDCSLNFYFTTGSFWKIFGTTLTPNSLPFYSLNKSILSLAAETIFMAFVICCVFLTDSIRSLTSLRFPAIVVYL